MSLVLSVLIGTVVPFGRPRGMSAIDKRPVSGPVAVRPLGLEGDEQGDPARHGGADKAIHCYSFEHYEHWRAELGDCAVLRSAGAFGENLSVAQLSEDRVCLGDRWQIGTALFQVTQARQPCWKLNHRFGVADMSWRVQSSLRTGWYLRVLLPGTLQPGDPITVIDRPHPTWFLSRLLTLLYRDALNADELEAALRLPLTSSWRKLLEARRRDGRVEDWRARLQEPVD